MPTIAPVESPPPKLSPTLRASRVVLTLAAYVLVLGISLFGSSGTLDWIEAWGFLALWSTWMAFIGSYLFRHNPDLLRERLRVAPVQHEQKGWDKVVSVILVLTSIPYLLLPGLDHRFGWTHVPLGIEVAAFAGILPCLGLLFWVMRENTFLSRVVKIDRARGHKVVTTGPYRYVRHPMYVGALVLYACMPLALGSFAGLVPAALLSTLIVVRTSLEDRTLHAELEGYVEYARQTRYRLIPGVW